MSKSEKGDFGYEVFDESSSLHDGRIPNLSGENNLISNQVLSSMTKPVFDFGTMAGLSILAAPAIVTGIKLGVGKVSKNQSYGKSFEEIKGIRYGDFYELAIQNFKRRSTSSLLPATFSGITSDALGLNSAQTAAVNTIFETVVASFIFKESKERFDAGSAGVKGSDPEEMNKRFENYKRNLPAQAAMLALRNGIFSAAIFMAKPAAKEIATKVLDDGDESLRSSVETGLTYGIRGALALATTPFDRVFTQVSIGDRSFSEVAKDLVKDVKSGDVSKLFKGGAARTVLCLVTASTVAEGLYLSKNIQDSSQDAVKVMTDVVHVVSSKMSKITEGVVDILAGVNSQEGEAKKVLSDSLKKAADLGENILEQSKENQSATPSSTTITGPKKTKSLEESSRTR